MIILNNPRRESSAPFPDLDGIPFPSTAWHKPVNLLARCPRHARTPLQRVSSLADQIGVAEVFLKDERDRMGLGSFKALGAAYVIACDASNGVARGRTYVTASAGNHGMSVAAGAEAFGARSVVFISHRVPQSFETRLSQAGARVVREGEDYEASMEAAATFARKNGAVLLSDSSWQGYIDRPHLLMEGYLALMQEIHEELPQAPSHIFLQAGVGGLAASAAAFVRAFWGDEPRVIVVEPEFAPCLFASIAAGHPVHAGGPASAMGRLDCKEASLIALKGLARDADHFATISEAEGATGSDLCAWAGCPTTPSGAAGLAGLAASSPYLDALGLGPRSTVLCIVSESVE